jgi:hypothetical protein
MKMPGFLFLIYFEPEIWFLLFGLRMKGFKNQIPETRSK